MAASLFASAQTAQRTTNAPFWSTATPVQRFLETVIAEAHTLAISVAVVTTAANALDDWRTPIDAKSIEVHRPQVAALSALLMGLDANDHDAQFSAPLAIEALDAIADGNAKLDEYLADCATLNASRAATLHTRSLQNVWRAAARRMAEMVVAWERETSGAVPEVYQKNTQVLTSLLSSASGGLRPCLNASGKLYVPPLPQRRRFPRRAMLEACTVFCNGIEREAFVRDVSAGGLGLDRVQGLKRGDVVSVSFNTGRHLTGRITWATGQGAGVTLHQPLNSSDPLICG